MSIEKLKAARLKAESDGIGVYLGVVKKLFAAIDEHVSESEVEAVASVKPDTTAVAELEVTKEETVVEAAVEHAVIPELRATLVEPEKK